jgi:NADH-quinone oxidoreductase subunit L
MESLLWLIPVAPLVGFLVNGGAYLYASRHAGTPGGHGHDHGHGHAPEASSPDHTHKHDEHHGHEHHGDHGGHGHDDHHHHGTPGERVGLPSPVIAAIAIAGPLLSFVLSVMAFFQVQDGKGPIASYFHWMTAGNLDVTFGMQVDALTAVMLLNVTGIGTLIHLYSYGYMKDDVGFARFMAYLNLFMFSMLILVIGDNLPMLFVGWEGVGLCSYLLIGFWYHELPNVDAARKAFVVNRIGDFAFLLGMFTLFSLAGTLGFDGMQSALEHADVAAILAAGPFAGWTVGGAMTFAALCLFIGATGKSAQIPLYVWLPDAMAGPTPVSALIHAATMVTAGVYMVGRLDFLYVHTPEITALMALIAACTALLSGLIALGQYDIKKVLAYSTVSQLGFMFAGMASMVFVGGLFHVLTHAFFKALLFLGSGAVIMAMHHEQDVRKMGGLWKDLRGVAVLFIIGSIALAGVPPFAGFWSKDEILGSVHYQMTTQGGVWILAWWMLVLTALLTAFYSTRLVMLTFFGPPADPHRKLAPVHWSMTVVLGILAVLSVFGGALAGPLEHFTEPVWSHVALDHEALHHSHTVAMAFSIAAVAIGIGSGVFLYGFAPKAVDVFANGAGAPALWLANNKFFVDEIYDYLVVKPLGVFAKVLWSVVDRIVIDQGMVEGSGKAVYSAGAALRRTQAGALNAATASMVVGTVGILAYVLWLVVVNG